MALSETKKGEIALKVLKILVYKEGLMKISADRAREFPNVAKMLGISVEEYKEFDKEIAQELLDKMYK